MLQVANVTILRLRAHPVLAEDRLFAMAVRDAPWVDPNKDFFKLTHFF